jgi:hypothetical protein
MFIKNHEALKRLKKPNFSDRSVFPPVKRCRQAEPPTFLVGQLHAFGEQSKESLDVRNSFPLFLAKVFSFLADFVCMPVP